MWPSWLWVTPLGEVPAVLCPVCLAPKAGQMCCWLEHISSPAEQTQQDAGTLASFLSGLALDASSMATR